MERSERKRTLCPTLDNGDQTVAQGYQTTEVSGDKTVDNGNQTVAHCDWTAAKLLQLKIQNYFLEHLFLTFQKLRSFGSHLELHIPVCSMFKILVLYTVYSIL